MSMKELRDPTEETQEIRSAISTFRELQRT